MTAVPMTAVAVGTKSMLRLELRACCYCDSRVRLSELHQPVAGQDSSQRLAADSRHRCKGSVSGIGGELGGGSQIACTPVDRERKTMSGCDDWGDETNSFFVTSRYVWEANSTDGAPADQNGTVPNESL